MKHYYLAALAFVLCCSFHANAQIGFKAYVFEPRGDIGRLFKTGSSYELYYLNDNFHGRVRSSIGLGYASAAPRQDTVPNYSAGGSPFGLTPEGTVYKSMHMYYAFIDEAVQVFSIKRFSFYAGVRIMVGLSKSAYTTYYPSDPTRADEGHNDDSPRGFGGNLQAVYTIGSHVQVCAEIGHNALVAKDWSYSQSHHFFGLGINYRIKSN